MQLKQALYMTIGCCHEVYRQLGPGLPEYVYQEALASELSGTELVFHKELEFHPLYKDIPLKTYIKNGHGGGVGGRQYHCGMQGHKSVI